MNTNQIDEESNSISIGGLSPLQKRQNNNAQLTKKQDGSEQENINKLEHRLVSIIQIITPIQLQSHSFRKQLKTFRFQRKSKAVQMFCDFLAPEEREIQQIFGTLKEIFSEWRTKITNRFYIVFNNRDLFYFFHKVQEEDLKHNTKKGGSFSVINCRKTDYAKILDDYEIKYEKVTDSGYQSRILLIKNNDVQLFWRYLTNSLMKEPTQVELISNFYFMNSTEVLPVEIYNGKEQRPEFEYIAHKKINILQEVENQMYSVKMEGYWVKQNLQILYKKVQQVCKGKPFSLKFDCHSGSPDMKEFYDNL